MKIYEPLKQLNIIYKKTEMIVSYTEQRGSLADLNYNNIKNLSTVNVGHLNSTCHIKLQYKQSTEYSLAAGYTQLYLKQSSYQQYAKYQTVPCI